MMVQNTQAMKQQAEAYSELTSIHASNPPAVLEWGGIYFEGPLQEAFGVKTSVDFQYRRIVTLLDEIHPRTARIVSIAAGECTEEIEIVVRLKRAGKSNYQFICIDVASGAIARAEGNANALGVADNMTFLVGMFEEVLGQPTDVYIVNQALHHFTELEDLFDNIKVDIGEKGIFLTNDMIGRNGHMLWPEALAIVDSLWHILPDKYKYNHCLNRFENKFGNWDNSKEENEGIRAQDILPELMKRFHFEQFFAAGNISLTLFGRHFGGNYDLKSSEDRRYFDMISRLDYDLIDIGYLKPTLMFACMTNRRVETICYKHWTPEFCVRTESPFASVEKARQYAVGETVEFVMRSPAVDCLREGWSSLEETGVWSNSDRSSIGIPLEKPLPSGEVTLTMAAMQFRPPGIEVGPIDVVCNGVECGPIEFVGHETGSLSACQFSFETAGCDEIAIELRYRTPISPFEFGISNERRRFALRLRFLEISAFRASPAPGSNSAAER